MFEMQETFYLQNVEHYVVPQSNDIKTAHT